MDAKLDEKLTASIQQWLATPAAERDTAAGALMLYQLSSRYKFLYRATLARPEANAERVERELQKHLQIRLAGYTLAEVGKMNRRVMSAAVESIESKGGKPFGPEFAGKRADHDDLPEDIRAIYERNGEVWKKLKKTYETLQLMESAPMCDRFEQLQILTELDDEYRENWEKYDHFDANADDTEEEDEEGEEAAVTATAKQVIAARKFISVNRKIYEKMTDDDDTDGTKRAALKTKLQERISFLLEAGENFSDETKEALQALGFEF